MTFSEKSAEPTLFIYLFLIFFERQSESIDGVLDHSNASVASQEEEKELLDFEGMCYFLCKNNSLYKNNYNNLFTFIIINCNSDLTANSKKNCNIFGFQT